MGQLFAFVFVSVAIEGITFYIKAIAAKELPKSCVISILLGIFMAISFNLDLFHYFEIESIVPYAGNVFTGVLLSRGSNYFFDLIGSMSNFRRQGV